MDHLDKSPRECNSYVSPATMAVADARSLKGLHVLVVQHEPGARSDIARVLENQGAHVTAVGSAAKAYKILREEHPSLLIAEVSMPYVDGYRFIRTVRMLASFEGGSIPAVALAAETDFKARKRSLIHGFQLQLPNALDPIDLAARIGALAAECNLRPN